jgi:hypothetical protein
MRADIPILFFMVTSLLGWALAVREQQRRKRAETALSAQREVIEAQQDHIADLQCLLDGEEAADGPEEINPLN